MDLLLLSVVALVALALLFDFTNGFHDAANSVSTVVATKAMSARTAVWFSAACNFAALFVVGTAVANTVAKVVKPDISGVAVVFAALVAAIAWNYLTWWFGMPSSSSHAIIGGLVGAGLAAGGAAAIEWGKVRETALFIILSPVIAFTIAGLGYGVVRLLQMVTRWGDDAKPFKALQVVSAGAVSFGHGANDAQKTMGVIAALLVGSGYLGVGADGKIAVPLWVELSAYSAIAVGTAWGGWRIIETMGLKITNLSANTGVAANIGATTAIFGGTALGIPLSTTHAAASSVVGAGTAARRGTNWKVVGEMALAWVVTIPATALLSWVFYELTQLPTVAAWIVLAPVLTAMAGLIAYAMLHSTGADEVAQEVEAKVAETRLPVQAGSGTLTAA